MPRQQELHQTKKFHLPVFLKYSIECRQNYFTCGIHDQRGLRFSLLNSVFMWICHQVTFQEIVSEPQTPFCPASYLYFATKFIFRDETSTAFISETGRFPIVKFGQIRCFTLKLEHIKKSKQSEKVTLASRNTFNIDSNLNPDCNFAVQQTRSQYFSPHSLSMFKNTLKVNKDAYFCFARQQRREPKA